MDSNSLTILAPGTLVRGDIFSENVLILEGGVEGNINGNRVMVKKSGWVHGDLICRSLSIEPGGLIDGNVKVKKTSGLVSQKAEIDALPEFEEPIGLPDVESPKAETKEKDIKK